MKPSEIKHLPMRTFYVNKDGRSKDKNKNRFNFTSPKMKTNVNIIFFIEILFRVTLILSLMQTPSKGWITNNSYSQ